MFLITFDASRFCRFCVKKFVTLCENRDLAQRRKRKESKLLTLQVLLAESPSDGSEYPEN